MGFFRPQFLTLLASLIAAGLLVAATAARRFVFEDITASSGIRFSAENGASAEKKMIETMGSGVGVLDYDRDGRLDFVFVNGGGRPGSVEAGHNRLALYHNLGNNKFEDRTAAAHLSGSFETYGMGVAVADYDNDGYPDLCASTACWTRIWAAASSSSGWRVPDGDARVAIGC